MSSKSDKKAHQGGSASHNHGAHKKHNHGRQKGTPWYGSLVSGTSIIVVGIVALVLTLLASSVWLKEKQSVQPVADSAPQRKHPAVQHFKVDESPVYVIEDFFPDELVAEWKSLLRQEWEAGRWYYTTNNNGTEDDNMLNRKVISRKHVEERKKLALKMEREGKFAYSKWELERNNSVHLKLKAYMEHPNTLTHVAKLIQSKPGLESVMGDFFVTVYREGDFLSGHTDVYGGTWAVVSYFTEGEARGGHLSFFCQSTQTWCHEVVPGGNTLVLFRTRHPSGPLHRVEMVHGGSGDYFRWGTTGWYDEKGDVLNKQEEIERDKMRKPLFDRSK